MEEQKTYDSIRDRYLQALKQSSGTTVFALVFGVAAAGLFIATLVVLSFNEWQFDATSVALLIGTGEAAALAIVAFIVAAADRRHLVAIIDTVRVDWKLREAVRLAESVTDDELRTRLVAALALQLSGILPTAAALRELSRREHGPQALTVPAPRPETYYAWRSHFRRAGRHERRTVLECDRVGRRR
jgi:hypothetical protein